jgi:hypothetical protein
MKALGIATLNPLIMAPLYVINAGIVDARNGAAPANTGMTTYSDIGKEDEEKLVDMFTKNLKKLPSGTPAEKK